MPTFVIFITYVILDELNKRPHQMVFPGLSLENLLMFILCTPVQVSQVSQKLSHQTCFLLSWKFRQDLHLLHVLVSSGCLPVRSKKFNWIVNVSVMSKKFIRVEKSINYFSVFFFYIAQKKVI